MVDLGSLVLLMGVFGWKGSAVVYVVFGLIVAVAGGTLIEALRLDDQVEPYIRGGKVLDQPQETLKISDRLSYAWEQVVSTAKKVFPYVLVGVGIGAVIHNWIPADYVVALLGSRNPFGVILATGWACHVRRHLRHYPHRRGPAGQGGPAGRGALLHDGRDHPVPPLLILLRKAVKPKLLGILHRHLYGGHHSGGILLQRPPAPAGVKQIPFQSVFNQIMHIYSKRRESLWHCLDWKEKMKKMLPACHLRVQLRL